MFKLLAQLRIKNSQKFLGEEERKAYTNLTAWYLNIVGLDNTIGSKDLPKEAHKAFKAKANKGKKEEAPKAEEDDLFGDDDAPAPVAAKPKPEVKKKKEKPAAKSIVVFDVKVYEQETDLLALFEKIKK